MKKNITSADVARLAGVSQSAVSRTYTPGASASKATRTKVLDAARKLGYMPDRIARTLITRRSNIIGVAISYLENQFYPLVLEMLSKKLQRRGYHALLFITEAGEADALVAEILSYQVDALVLASTTLSSPVAKHCADAGIPVVLLNRSNADHAVSSVVTDNVAGGRAAAEHLADVGARKIAFMAGLETASTSVERERGFNEGLAARRLRCFGRGVGHYDFARTQQATRELFGVGEQPDAVFVANDHMAFAVMDTLRSELGLKIPEDVAVVGFDNVPISAWSAYQLTTVEQAADPMTDMAIELVCQQIESRSIVVQDVRVPCRLIVRASSVKQT